MIDLTSNETVLLHDDSVVAAVAPKVNDQVAFSLSRWQITCLHWLIIAAVAAVVTRVMWAPALLWGHSAWFDLTRMVEFDAAIRAGDYWPLWAPDFYRGYGSPIFQFYAPLVYFLAEIPVLAGCNIATALKITQLVLLLGSGVAMYHFAAVHVSRWAACCGAVLYMFAPYRMLDLFARHALAEHAAFVWLPLLALGTERFISTRRRVSAALAILATAGLILTHNVMALLGLPVCVAAGCLLSGRMREWRSVFFAACPAVIGVGLSAFFWWPALTGRGFTKAEQSLTGGFFDFHQHFVTARELLDPAWAFADSGATVAAQMPLHIGVP